MTRWSRAEAGHDLRLQQSATSNLERDSAPVTGEERKAPGRAASFAVVLGAYAVAAVVFVLVATAVGRTDSWWAVSAGYLASVVVLYVAGQAVRNAGIFGPWWSVMPCVAAVWVATGADGIDQTRRWLVPACVLLWGIRSTVHWALCWPGLVHRSWRHADLYRSGRAPRWLVDLVIVHLVPTIIVALACLPMVAALSNTGNELGPLDVVAAVVIVLAVLLELVADEQLRRFNRRKSPDELMDRGLWARSRHPNYLGEIGFWWGLWVFALASSWDSVWTVIGPIEITVMFIVASIPLSERRSAATRFGWFDYVERTPVLLPRLRSS